MTRCDICGNEQGTVKYHDMMNEDKIICIECAKAAMNSAPNTTIVYK
jgi:formylmethanofuran dehydrogenase subunit E